MKPVSLLIKSPKGVEARICTDGSEGGFEDYYAVVSVTGIEEERKVYGVDPIQSFALAWQLIDQLTTDKRLAGDKDVVDGASWWIETALDMPPSG